MSRTLVGIIVICIAIGMLEICEASPGQGGNNVGQGLDDLNLLCLSSPPHLATYADVTVNGRGYYVLHCCATAMVALNWETCRVGFLGT
ncbi:hypothetical protein Ocin01_14538 [Orchesella cincta]|uniref:Uncharacterized protein n=1 Tax=Orchesella cincta TaxID=48709 RepID=A0A1D2MH00_ORCCI|nr:hypothetical protein Ocin01_14538 [Orchesella cincta]